MSEIETELIQGATNRKSYSSDGIKNLYDISNDLEFRFKDIIFLQNDANTDHY